MSASFSEQEADALNAPDAPSFSFTAIVPAAGLGTRLGYTQPKILYPILGQPILAILLRLLLRRCERVVLVVSKVGRPAIERALAEHFPLAPVTLAEQAQPRGMGDAILAAEPYVPFATYPHCLVVWGDQVTLEEKTLERLQRLHAHRPNAKLTLATIERENPYIHFERCPEGKIIAVHEARRGPLPWARGENDCGLFAFHTHSLFDILRSAPRSPMGGDELNLLPHFPRFEQGRGSVATLRLTDDTETLGVNTQGDARRVEEILLKRGRIKVPE